MCRLFKILPLMLALAALSIFAGCGSNNSQVRVVNAIPNSPPSGLDVYFNGTKNFTAVPFDTVSPSSNPATYNSVPSGSDTIQAYVTGSTANPYFGGNGA